MMVGDPVTRVDEPLLTYFVTKSKYRDVYYYNKFAFRKCDFMTKILLLLTIETLM